MIVLAQRVEETARVCHDSARRGVRMGRTFEDANDTLVTFAARVVPAKLQGSEAAASWVVCKPRSSLIRHPCVHSLAHHGVGPGTPQLVSAADVAACMLDRSQFYQQDILWVCNECWCSTLALSFFAFARSLVALQSRLHVGPNCSFCLVHLLWEDYRKGNYLSSTLLASSEEHCSHPNARQAVSLRPSVGLGTAQSARKAVVLTTVQTWCGPKHCTAGRQILQGAHSQCDERRRLTSSLCRASWTCSAS